MGELVGTVGFFGVIVLAVLASVPLVIAGMFAYAGITCLFRKMPKGKFIGGKG